VRGALVNGRLVRVLGAYAGSVIRADPFLAAVTGHDESARIAWALAQEMHPTLTERFDA